MVKYNPSRRTKKRRTTSKRHHRTYQKGGAVAALGMTKFISHAADAGAMVKKKHSSKMKSSTKWKFINKTFQKNKKAIWAATAMTAVSDIYGLSFLGPIVFATSKILLDLLDFSPTVMVDGFIDKYTEEMRDILHDTAVIIHSGPKEIDNKNAKKQAMLIEQIRKQEALINQMRNASATAFKKAVAEEEEKKKKAVTALKKQLKTVDAFSALHLRAWPRSCEDLHKLNVNSDTNQQQAIEFLNNGYCNNVKSLLQFDKAKQVGGTRRRRKSRRRRGKRRSTRRRRRRSR